MINDCVTSHRAWITASARATGGQVGQSGSVDWGFVPSEGTLHLLFPESPTPEHVSAAVTIADALGARSTALWLARDLAMPWLEELGFERGWQPWWMEIDPNAEAAVGPAGPAGRARLSDTVRKHDRARESLLDLPAVRLAEAFERGHYAGKAWLHLEGDVGGLYDVAVLKRFRRRGLGTDLVTLLTRSAAAAGARVVTLNATPEGFELYRACGFTMLGAGQTYWRHRRHA